MTIYRRSKVKKAFMDAKYKRRRKLRDEEN